MARADISHAWNVLNPYLHTHPMYPFVLLKYTTTYHRNRIVRPPITTRMNPLSIDKPNIVQMGKLNNSIDVRQKPTLNGTLNGTSLKYLNMV